MPKALIDQAIAALQRGDVPRAELAYREAVKADPSFEALDGLASLLAQTGRPAEAAPLFVRALESKPDDPVARSNYGGVLESLGRPADALEQYDRALTIAPGFADAYLNRTAVLTLLGRNEEALAALDQVLAAAPNLLLALYNRGVALAGLERFGEAVEAYDRVVAVYPNHPQAWINRGVALSRLERFAEAIESFDRALRLRPNVPQALVNRGGAQMSLKQFAPALISYERALAIAPNDVQAWFNRGVLLIELKRIPDAIKSYDRALALDPGHDMSAYNRALCLLQLGHFEEGFRLYETRNRMAATPPAHPQPQWSGEDITGQTLLVRGEQGLGDIIQFARYLKLLDDRGIKVILSVPPVLVRLLQSLQSRPAIIARDDTPPPFDWQVALESLPYAFGTTLDSIPANIPYLQAEPGRVAAWKARLGEDGFKIGIAWQSSAHGTSIGKTFAPNHYEPLGNIPGVRLISLQKTDEAGALKDLPPGMAVETLGDDFDAGPDAFLDSAAVMQSLDLVIAPDTALAHLAGALGRPAWVALKHVPDWRWMLDRADTPWYPATRLFRQPRPDDWTGLFADIVSALAEAMVRKGTN